MHRIRQGCARFNIPLQIFIDHLLFRLQPVIKGMAIPSTMLLIQRVGSFGDTRVELLSTFISLAGSGGLRAPWFGRISSGTLCWP
jgi:hypothetical protein